jgi:glutamate-1-semialdehyde 2,1-aminomutase
VSIPLCARFAALAALRASCCAAKARTSSTSITTNISITLAPGVRCSLAIVPRRVIDALSAVLELGTSFGAPTGREVELAQLIIDAVPSIEMVRLVNSGTEACMSAIRLARGFTGRDLTVKFDGCYHGHVDSLLVKAGSGVATLSLPDTAGVPKAFSDTTLALPLNDLDVVETVFKQRGESIASVIIEPVVGNMGCIPPAPGFLEGLRRITQKYGALLIFDEVMTGFRLSRGGAQQMFNIEPDLTTLGKIIGGGLPIAAYGGRADIMNKVAPVGPVYQAGTLSGNPLAVSAGIAMLTHIEEHPETYDILEQRTAALTANPPAGMIVNRVGSMATFFFQTGPVRNADDARRSDTATFRQVLSSLARTQRLLSAVAIRSAFRFGRSLGDGHRTHSPGYP